MINKKQEIFPYSRFAQRSMPKNGPLNMPPSFSVGCGGDFKLSFEKTGEIGKIGYAHLHSNL